MDKSGQGLLSKSNFRAGIKQLFGVTLSNLEADQIMSWVDANGRDSGMNYTEFLRNFGPSGVYLGALDVLW